MTDSLSLAARRILAAAGDHKTAAATLRATAKIVAPEAAPHRRKIRAELLDLATELDATDD